MKTAELIGRELDCWAGRGAGKNNLFVEKGRLLEVSKTGKINPSRWRPSVNWTQGGPIIEKLKPINFYFWEPTNEWSCSWGSGHRWEVGPTALIAAMRCYVASKFGDEVDDSQAHNV